MIARRIWAFIIDFILLLGLVAFIPAFVIQQPGQITAGLKQTLMYFAICIALEIFFLAFFAATPGKIFLRLTVVHANAGPLSLFHRLLGPLISILGGLRVGPGPKASALMGSAARHWYDIYLKTKVVDSKTDAADIRPNRNLAMVLAVALP